MTNHIERVGAEARFREVFAHLGAVTASARRRGSNDADGLAAGGGYRWTLHACAMAAAGRPQRLIDHCEANGG